MDELIYSDGYVLLPRSLRKTPTWLSLTSKQKIIFLELMLQAQFQSKEVVRGGEIIFLKRGQIATSYQQLVNDIKDKEITQKIIRVAIEKFIRLGLLAKDEAKAKAKKGLLLTIVNYNDIQNPSLYRGKGKSNDSGITKTLPKQFKGNDKAINNNIKELKTIIKNNEETINFEKVFKNGGN
ncbi:hypothetical protein [Priestia megaterium]|uniref:hypothetical protein n=1 Tax=Priestia megaterium TaxID=1404 RepID=UPI000BF52BE1|nr:hypothetical protein [Priestia megaterium]PFR94852.1 hypothetical protein COK39_15065 [Priestia megaterium]